MKNRILFLLFFCAPFSAHPQTGQLIPPNHYQLQGDHLHVTYSTSSFAGKPQFSYQDGSQSLSFSGDQIRTTRTEIGTLVTVTIRMTVDTGSTSFTLLIPTVNLAPPGTPATVHTVGITTVHKFSVVPAVNQGQTELYTETQLTGTASHVIY